MKFLIYTLCLALAACASSPATPPDTALDASPPFEDASVDATIVTWDDAATVFSDAWCLYADRCYPGYVALHYGTQATCVSTETAADCAALDFEVCWSAYPPDLLLVLAQCHADFATWSCDGAYVAPASCTAAFP